MGHLLRPSSFASAGKLLFLNEELSDVTVIVKTEIHQWQFPAHALILSAESHVFQTMLAEKSAEGEVKPITISDMTPATTELLLKYLYSGKLEVENWMEGLDLLQAAFNYKVESLIQKCGKFLENVINLTNVCHLYAKASSCALPVLRDKCLKLILDAGFIVLRSKAFDMLSKACVMEVVSSSDLNIDHELVVFETLYRWSRMECCRTEQEVTDENILCEMKPFLEHVCVDDMSDADKSALPPTILSCVKPNNRNRVGFSVLESLLMYSVQLELEMTPNCMDYIGDNLSFLRFSVDSPVHLIGMCFRLVAGSLFRLNLMPLTLVKENAPKTNLITLDLSSAEWIPTLRFNSRVCNDAKVILNKPIALKPKEVYNIFSKDRCDSQCFRMTLPTPISSLHRPSGTVNVTVHGNAIWGITTLIFI